MKKIWITLIAVVGLGIGCFVLFTSSRSGADCSDCTCCGTPLYWSSQAYQTEKNCWRCGGDGLVTGTCYNCEQCRECGATGKQKCRGWESCSSCRGTGCKNGYTTNNGQNCAYGHCSTCQGQGGRYVMDRWKDCPNCSACGGDGLRDVLRDNQTGCTSCGGDSKHAGSGREYTWHSGCKCSRCGKGYTGCN